MKTLLEAKEETWALQDDIAARIPSGFVLGEPTRAEEAPLLDRCDGDNVWRWPGIWAVDIDPAFATREFLVSLEQEWSGRPGWTVEPLGDSSSLYVERDDGLWFSVFATEGNSLLNIGSNSSCFQLDTEYVPGSGY